MNPTVSIIIPCFNHGKYIQETLDSIELAKRKYAVEVIVVNDGSSDEYTVSILKQIEKKGYCVLNQANEGLGSARNNGIKLAKGKYILPLDSDNKVLSPYLNEAVDILEENKLIDIVYGNATYFGEKEGDWSVGDYSILKLITGNYIDACAIYRKSVWQNIGGYDEKMPVMGIEDWDFWLAISFKGFRFYYLKENCFEYRVLKDSMIHSLTTEKSEEVFQYIQKKHYYGIINENLENFFFKRFNENARQIAKHVTIKNLFISIFIKISIKLESLINVKS